MNLLNLDSCFKTAIKKDMKYVGVKIKMQGFIEPEVIINQKENFEDKLAYYKKAYNEDLTLKTFNGIKIVNFAYGNSYEEIENALV